MWKKIFHGTKNYSHRTYQVNIAFQHMFFLLNRAAGELYDLAEVCDPECNYTTIGRMSKSCPNDVNT